MEVLDADEFFILLMEGTKQFCYFYAKTIELKNLVNVNKW